MPLKIKLHAVPYLKGLIYGKDIPGRYALGGSFMEGVAQTLSSLRPFELLKCVAALFFRPHP